MLSIGWVPETLLTNCYTVFFVQKISQYSAPQTSRLGPRCPRTIHEKVSSLQMKCSKNQQFRWERIWHRRSSRALLGPGKSRAILAHQLCHTGSWQYWSKLIIKTSLLRTKIVIFGLILQTWLQLRSQKWSSYASAKFTKSVLINQYWLST